MSQASRVVRFKSASLANVYSAVITLPCKPAAREGSRADSASTRERNGIRILVRFSRRDSSLEKREKERASSALQHTEAQRDAIASVWSSFSANVRPRLLRCVQQDINLAIMRSLSLRALRFCLNPRWYRAILAILIATCLSCNERCTLGIFRPLLPNGSLALFFFLARARTAADARETRETSAKERRERRVWKSRSGNGPGTKPVRRPLDNPSAHPRASGGNLSRCFSDPRAPGVEGTAPVWSAIPADVRPARPQFIRHLPSPSALGDCSGSSLGRERERERGTRQCWPPP